MGEPRTTLWSRLVVFYSVNKRDQLNAKVSMTDHSFAGPQTERDGQLRSGVDNVASFQVHLYLARRATIEGEH